MTVVRRVTIDDAAVVCTFVNDLLTELLGDLLGVTHSLPEVMQVISQTDRVFGFLAISETKPVGICMLTENVAIFSGGRFGMLTELYVEPKVRSQKVAAQLLEVASDFGRAKGWGSLEVGAPPQPRWARSLNFYRRAGFVEVGPRLRLRLACPGD
jgi:GNAT superfamily N-acetyltransferase